jgi:hypothetical protein
LLTSLKTTSGLTTNTNKSKKKELEKVKEMFRKKNKENY